METRFYINLNIKTGDGYQVFARYYLGDDRRVANEIFEQLKGDKDANEEQMLHLDFLEMVDNLPVNINVMGCNLSELAENTRIVTREIFKNLNLGA